jgi:hypothetical protein
VRNGDISNETPARLIVLADVVSVREEVTQKKFLKTTTSLKVSNVNKQAVAQLWILTNKYGLSVELAGVEDDGWDQSSLDKVMNILDRRGGNPFNFAQVYSSTQELVDDLPYRVNLRGVVDIPTKVAMYGSFGIELGRL